MPGSTEFAHRGLRRLVGLGCEGVTLCREATRSVLDFLAKLFSTVAGSTTVISPEGRSAFQAVVQSQGQSIFCIMLAGVGGALPQPRVPDVAETMHVILKVLCHLSLRRVEC